MNPILECIGLTKVYSSNHIALNNVNLTLERGQIVGLLGPNGSGKTTLIKLVNDILSPSSGSVLIGGQIPGAETKGIVSYLPDRFSLNDSWQISQALTYFEDFYEDFQRDRAIHMLEDLNIDLKARIKSLSKGTKEKLHLILTMSRNAQLYVLDEPIGGVDPAARDYILKTIIGNYNENATVLLSTHLIQDVENILDRVLFLKAGQVVLNSAVDDIRTQQGKSVDSLFREVFKC